MFQTAVRPRCHGSVECAASAMARGKEGVGTGLSRDPPIKTTCAARDLGPRDSEG